MFEIEFFRENMEQMMDMSVLGPFPCALFYLFGLPAMEMSMLFQNTLYMRDVGYSLVASFLEERFNPFLVTTDYLLLLLAQYFLLAGRFRPAFGMIAFANLQIALRLDFLYSLKDEGHEDGGRAFRTVNGLLNILFLIPLAAYLLKAIGAA
ncbi:MAG: hypothetical protein ACOX5A_00705 [Aminivibrio sp.]|jgi:hypothetical protein